MKPSLVCRRLRVPRVSAVRRPSWLGRADCPRSPCGRPAWTAACVRWRRRWPWPLPTAIFAPVTHATEREGETGRTDTSAPTRDDVEAHSTSRPVDEPVKCVRTSTWRRAALAASSSSYFFIVAFIARFSCSLASSISSFCRSRSRIWSVITCYRRGLRTRTR